VPEPWLVALGAVPAAADGFAAAGNPIGIGSWGTEWIRDWTRHMENDEIGMVKMGELSRPALVEAGVTPEALAAVAEEGTEAVTRSLGARLDAFAKDLSEPDLAALIIVLLRAMDPIDRARFEANGLITDEQEALLSEIERRRVDRE
jgi:hypothetical protein